ncbi:MAG TPA: hypothetical protein PLR74_16900, partial [Agriterribacter sp.]|nr:hypothetical protein [Agriterribacter sp.]
MINSKRSRSLWKYGYVPFLWISILLASCNQKEKITGVDPAFSRYVEGYTSGVISKAAVIR